MHMAIQLYLLGQWTMNVWILILKCLCSRHSFLVEVLHFIALLPNSFHKLAQSSSLKA